MSQPIPMHTHRTSRRELHREIRRLQDKVGQGHEAMRLLSAVVRKFGEAAQQIDQLDHRRTLVLTAAEHDIPKGARVVSEIDPETMRCTLVYEVR